jgi:tRNA threonylcarbamoyladenosine biosynthesis protein TsaB
MGETAGADRDCLAVLDARRGEAFAALYAADGSRSWGPFVAAPAELADRVGALPQPPLAAGSGAVRFRDELASRDVEVPGDADPVHRVAARHVCALAGAGGGVGDDRLDPIYLRPPDAQRWRERNDVQTAE